jgi:predicted enzyme related to lactoylglutathione lyase
MRYVSVFSYAFLLAHFVSVRTNQAREQARSERNVLAPEANTDQMQSTSLVGRVYKLLIKLYYSNRMRARKKPFTVKRIVTNIPAKNVAAATPFYGDIFGLEPLMDLSWIVTYGSPHKMSVQLSIATEGGSGTPAPDISIEVDDVDAALNAVKKAGFPIEYGPVDEPWGVRRFMCGIRLESS